MHIPAPSSHYKARTAARMAVIQALFQIEQAKISPSVVIAEFLEYRFKEKKKKLDTSFFVKVVEGAWKDHPRNDELVEGTLKVGWQHDRLESVTRAILRAALFEITDTQTPAAVIINEYLNLTRSFFDDSEVAFVNGVLNTLSQKIRA